MASLAKLVQYIRQEMPKGGYHPFLYSAVRVLRPRKILELGTGVGGSTAAMMRGLPGASTLTTVNLPNPPSGDPVGEKIGKWRNDTRFYQIFGDSREVRGRVGNGFDFLYIDTEHTYDVISAEWALYESALADVAMVMLDDILVNDMPRFWEELPYEKILADLHPSGLGVFRYRRDVC